MYIECIEYIECTEYIECRECEECIECIVYSVYRVNVNFHYNGLHSA